MPTSTHAALKGVFDSITSDISGSPGPGQAGQIHTAEDWSRLLSAITSAGLLPQSELLDASRDLSLPTNLAHLSKRLQSAHELTRAREVDGLFDGAVNRVRHLHGLLAEWELGALSPEHTARLLTIFQALRHRLSVCFSELRLWHDGVHAALGPESCQTLFWDLIDPVASEQVSPHAFQRDQMAAIEKRCTAMRVRTALVPPDPSLAAYNSAALPSAAKDAAASATKALMVDVVVGTDSAGTKCRVLRCQHAATWGDTARFLAWADATKQLSLSRHAPAYLGQEPCVHADAVGYPAHARVHLELVQGAPLSDGLQEGGMLTETSLLFRHWRREILEGLCHISAHTTFLLTHSIGLRHAIAMDDGCRIVFDHLEWGAEFPERKATPLYSANQQQSRDTPSMIAAATGVDISDDAAAVAAAAGAGASATV